MLQGFNSLNYSYSPLDGSGVVRVLKNSSFSYWWSCLVCVCVCVCVCVGSCLLTHVLLTHPHSQQSLSILSVPCRMLLSGNKNENKMLPDFKKLQGSVRYRSQGTKHVTGAIFYLNYDKIQLTIFKQTVWCSVHSHCCATKLENFFSTS